MLLALFGQMERTYTVERAAHARAVAVAKGRQVGRPVTVSAAQLAYATQLRAAGDTVAEIVTKTGVTRSSLYRHMPPRPPEPLTAGGPVPPDWPDVSAAGNPDGLERYRGGEVVVAEPGERLVTVLLTLLVPTAADAEDAAQLAADAATGCALDVVHTAGVEGHLPAPGAVVVRAGRDQPWLVLATGVDGVRLREVGGDVVRVPRGSVRPDPLDRLTPTTAVLGEA